MNLEKIFHTRAKEKFTFIEGLTVETGFLDIEKYNSKS